MQHQAVSGLTTEKQSKIEKLEAELGELSNLENALQDDNTSRALIIREHQSKIDENNQELDYIFHVRKLKMDRIKILSTPLSIGLSSSALRKVNKDAAEIDPNIVPTLESEVSKRNGNKIKSEKDSDEESSPRESKSEESENDSGSEIINKKDKTPRSKSAKYKYKPIEINPEDDVNYVGGFLKKYCKRTVYLSKEHAVLEDENAHARCGKLRDLYIQYLTDMNVIENVPRGGLWLKHDLESLGIKQLRFNDGPVYKDLYCEATSKMPNEKNGKKNKKKNRK